MVDKKIISTENAPNAIGPYSQAVTAGGFIFCSGQIPINPETNKVIDDDVKKQTKCVMENLKAVLEAAGSSFEKTVKCTIFLADMNDFQAVNGIYDQYFGDNPPAREAVAVKELPKNVLIEISCIAIA